MRNRGFEICSKYVNDGLTLPVRKTKSSVAYDIASREDIVIPSIWKQIVNGFKNGFDFEIKPTLIHTGIKSYFGEDEVLILANRSSNPIKKGLVASNSIGIIESDYYNNESNEGELMYSYYNFFFNDTIIHKGDTIGQAYFQKFLIADDDNAQGIRKGGFGSTDEK